MGFRDNIRKLAYNLRRLPGERFEIRPYAVSTVRRIWSGSYPGDGIAEDTETAITEAGAQPPRVRALSGEEKALLGLDGTVWQVGPITPDFPGGGTAIEALKPSTLAAGEEFYVKLVGPEYPTGALFRVVEVRSDKTFGYRVTIKPVGVP